MDQETEVQVRVYPGAPEMPALIYLPGLHGDWTLVGAFRKALAHRMSFVEITYPRVLDWSLADYARHITEALLRHGIRGGWLLAESFGSQVCWAILERNNFNVHGVVLAGGFARHPLGPGVRLAQWIGGLLPLKLIVMALFGYAKIARMGHRNSPLVRAGIQEFLDRRTEADRKAAVHRLELIARYNPCEVVRKTKFPVFALTGMLDVVVPWVSARRWFRKNCPALRDYKVIAGADHTILASAPRKSADQIMEWVLATERTRAGQLR